MKRALQSLMFLSVFVCLVFAGTAAAQGTSSSRIDDIEARLENVENYLSGLQKSMKHFSMEILDNVNFQMQMENNRIAVLDFVNKGFSKINTNSGIFLISVNRRERVEKGYRLYLNIGNPNGAVYNGVTLTLRWGRSWNPELANPTFKQWRESLKEAEYEFHGDLPPGKWTEIVVDVTPVEDQVSFEYLEGEMTVKSAQLEKPAF